MTLSRNIRTGSRPSTHTPAQHKVGLRAIISRWFAAGGALVNRKKELEYALYASIGVWLSAYPYLGPVPNLCLFFVTGAYWIIVRGQFGNLQRLVGIRRVANYVLFWVLAVIGGGPMVLRILNGRRVGVASVLLPFLMAGVSGMTGQIQDLLEPWPEETTDFEMNAKTLEHQLCLAYFQTSGGMLSTVFAGVLLFSLWMQWEWARSWNPHYLPIYETILILYAVAIYVLGIVQPGLTRSKLIRREIMIYQASQKAKTTPGTLTAATITAPLVDALPKAMDNVTTAAIPAASSSNADAATAPFSAASPAPSTTNALDQLTEATTDDAKASMQPEQSNEVEAADLESTPDDKRSTLRPVAESYDEPAEKVTNKVFTDPAKSGVAEPPEDAADSREPGPPTGGTASTPN